MIIEKLSAIKTILAELNPKDRVILEQLLETVEPLLWKAHSQNDIQPALYHVLIQTLIENPYHAWLIEKLLDKIENSHTSIQETGGNHTQGQLSLKMHPDFEDKTKRLKNAIKFFENRKSLSLELAKAARAKEIKPTTPKLIMALDSLLDLITSFFAEPPQKHKKRKLPAVNLRPPGGFKN